jgi:hypothetical protein
MNTYSRVLPPIQETAASAIANALTYKRIAAWQLFRELPGKDSNQD